MKVLLGGWSVAKGLQDVSALSGERDESADTVLKAHTSQLTEVRAWR
ncbi:hypothetical protein [Xylanimonas allomyrinae]